MTKDEYEALLQERISVVSKKQASLLRQKPNGGERVADEDLLRESSLAFKRVQVITSEITSLAFVPEGFDFQNRHDVFIQSLDQMTIEL
jgi:hypothetical protein